jgi:hypothetical protein
MLQSKETWTLCMSTVLQQLKMQLISERHKIYMRHKVQLFSNASQITTLHCVTNYARNNIYDVGTWHE